MHGRFDNDSNVYRFVPLRTPWNVVGSRHFLRLPLIYRVWDKNTKWFQLRAKNWKAERSMKEILGSRVCQKPLWMRWTIPTIHNNRSVSPTPTMNVFCNIIGFHCKAQRICRRLKDTNDTRCWFFIVVASRSRSRMGAWISWWDVTVL